MDSARAAGWRATAPRFNNSTKGHIGIARFAKDKAVEGDQQTNSTWELLDRHQQPVRRCEWQMERSPAAEVDGFLMPRVGAAPAMTASLW